MIANIEGLEVYFKALTKAIGNLKDEIAEMQVQMKRAGEDREIENKEFQMTVSDQRDTQRLLTSALNFLKDFYTKKAAFLQKQEPAGPPPPAGFETYKNNGQSGGVMQLIEQIISDAKAMEAEAIRSEEDAQKAYDDFVKESDASIKAKSNIIVVNIEQEELVVTKGAFLLQLEQFSIYNAELYQSCEEVSKSSAVCDMGGSAAASWRT